jgi:DNA-binding transcriptional ArsR family regulator
MTNRKIFNKREPGANGKFFIPLPSDALHYIHHPKMSAEKLFLYLLLIDFYNPEEGFAFPSVDKLAISYGKAPDTTSRHLDDLKAVGLIDFPEKGHYVPLAPLDADTFYATYPDAWENYRKKLKRYESRKQASRDRMREWRLKHGYTD